MDRIFTNTYSTVIQSISNQFTRSTLQSSKKQLSRLAEEIDAKKFPSHSKMSAQLVQQVQPLSVLAPSSPVLVATQNDVAAGASKAMHSMTSGFGMFVFWFIMLTIFIWLIIFSLRPAWALAPIGSTAQNLDVGKILWTSIIIALIILVIAWLIKSFAGKRC